MVPLCISLSLGQNTLFIPTGKMESTRERSHSEVKMQLLVYRFERLKLTKTTVIIIFNKFILHWFHNLRGK